jgi:hypothetical protein
MTDQAVNAASEQLTNRLLNANKFHVIHALVTVMEMRATQKAYFKTRDHSLLIRSKELESLVDKELAELLN